MFESFLGGNPANEQPTALCASNEVVEEVSCPFFAIEDKTSQPVNLNIDGRNGLYRDLDYIKLGGFLVEETTIDIKTHTLTVTNKDLVTSEFFFDIDRQYLMAEYYNRNTERGAQLYTDVGGGYILYYDNVTDRQVIVSVDNTKASIGTFLMSPSFKVKEFASPIGPSTGLIIRDDIDLMGASYTADYSIANASNPRWLVDKGYVDGKFIKNQITSAQPTSNIWVSGKIRAASSIETALHVGVYADNNFITLAGFMGRSSLNIIPGGGSSLCYGLQGNTNDDSVGYGLFLSPGYTNINGTSGSVMAGLFISKNTIDVQLNMNLPAANTGTDYIMFIDGDFKLRKALASSVIGTPSLQAVTNVGNTTTNPIVISDSTPAVDSFLQLTDGTNFGYFGLTFTGVPTLKRTSTAGNIQLRIINNANAEVLWVTTDSTMFYNPSGALAITIDHNDTAGGVKVPGGKTLQFASAGRSLGDMVLGLDASLTLKSYTTGTNTIVMNPNSAAQTDGSGASTIKTTTVRLGIGANNRSDDLIIDSTKNFIIRDNGNTKTATFLCDASGQFRVNNPISSINHFVDYIVTPALAIDFNTGGMQSKSVAVNSTFTFSNSGNGKTVLVAITNTSGGAITVSFTGATMPVGASLSIAAGATSMFNFVTINSVIRGFEIKY